MEGFAPRLIAVDLDDTLLRPDLSVSPEDREALLAAGRAGIRVVLASGRNIHSMMKYAEDVGAAGEDGYLICSNGAEILRTGDGGIVRRNLMSPEDCREAATLVEEFGLAWQVYEGGKIHVSRENDWTRLDSGLTGQPTVLVRDREEYFARGQLKFVCPGDEGRVAEAAAFLSRRFQGRLSVVTSKPYFLEILDKGSDKGIALEYLSGVLGIARESVMAIGDAPNDLGMVRWAGIGCAVGNAVPEVKAAARLVAEPGLGGNAVAWLLKRVVPGLFGS